MIDNAANFFNSNLSTVIFGFTTIATLILIIINAWNSYKQNKNSIQSARDERFKNAIEQLGSEKNAVVLGAIYTLHRIAKEDKTYVENVFNILCSYLRDTTSAEEYQKKYKEKPSEVIQTILNILCVNEKDRKVYTRFIERITQKIPYIYNEITKVNT